MKKSFALSCICALLLFSLVTFVPDLAIGDAGNFAGSSSYGGSSSSSSSSSSSYSGSSDYDYDDSDSEYDWLITIVVVAFILGVSFIKLMLPGSDSDESQPQGASVTDAALLSDLDELVAKDPLFNAAAVTDKLANTYVKIQNAWTAGDLEPVRPYFEDALYAQFERQLNSLKSQGHVNHVDNIAVLECVARGWFISRGNENLVCKVRTRITDYTVDSSGDVVQGSQDRELFMEYEYTLSRPEGTLTQAQGSEVAVHECPNCAAPLNEGASARCPYCGSVIAIKQHDWVISSIKGISQQTA